MIASKKKISFLDFFPVPKFLLLSSAGLSLTDSHVRYVRFNKGAVKGEFDLAQFADVTLNPGLIEEGAIGEKEQLTAVLKDFAGKNNIRYVHATLPEEQAYLFTTTIDKVPAEGLRDAVAFIIEENAPVSLAESVFDFELVDESVDSADFKVAVSVLPHKVVANYIEVLEAAGITPVSFDIESQAIARTVVPRGDVRPHLIVNLGTRKTGLYMVEDEVVQFSSTYPYGVGGEEASPTDELKSELQKLFAFWNSRTDKHGIPEKKIEKIYICGSGAGNGDFIKKLLEDFQIEYAQANVWINAFSSRDHVPEIAFEDSFAYAAAIGCALPARPKIYV